MSLSQSCVAKLYASVIDDVISGVREFFMDEGVDEQVLLELKQSWELKLKTTKAVEVPKPEPEPQPPILKNPPPPQPTQQKFVTMAGSNQAAAAAAAVNAGNHNNKTVSIQITLPGLNQNNEERRLTIDVPSSAIADNELRHVLTGPVISATMALPQALATTLLQQHVNAAFQGHKNGMVHLQVSPGLQGIHTATTTVSNGASSDAAQRQTLNQQGGVPQVDGVKDSSDEDDNEDDDNDDEDNDDDDDDDQDEDEEHDPEDQPAIEEEPLCSEDDVSEDDPTEMFETENVVVCQYDKITRSRNKWKFYLKDGIMNLGGKDFVFQKSSGDAEW